MIDFTGKVALVTGAGKGIGRAIALALAERGAAVVVNNRARDGVDSAGGVVAEVRRSGGRAVAERSSVEAPGAADAMVRAALDHFGRLDLVVSNAAVVERGRFANADPERFREVLEIDLMAPIDLARAALDELRAHGGRFLFVTSTAGTYGEFGVTSYATSKGGLSAFAKTLALELDRDGVMVNLLSPYAVTQMTEGFVTDEQARVMTAESVVPAAMWLLSPDVPVTGATVVAAANRFRAVAIGETGGISFPPGVDVTDEEFAERASQITDLGGWQHHADAITAFRHLLDSRPGRGAPR